MPFAIQGSAVHLKKLASNLSWELVVHFVGQIEVLTVATKEVVLRGGHPFIVIYNLMDFQSGRKVNQILGLTF